MCVPANAQYQIGHITLTFTDPSRNNRSIPTEIYYPADTAGNDVPVTTTTTDALPVLAFGHGFVMSWSAYENIWSTVVTQGYIIAFPKTETGITPSHIEFARDLAFVANQVSLLGASTTSIFYNRTSGQKVVMGHSMGGGAAFLAAGLDPSFTALITLSAAETNPSAISAAATVVVPSLVFAGANDCVTPPATNQLAMYNALTGDCKTYLEIIGGSHCQMADYNFLCSFGETTCSPAPAISRDAQHDVISNYLVKWLNAKLKSDCESGAAFDLEIENDAAVTFQKNCLLCNPLTTVANTVIETVLYPNPFVATLHISSGQNTEMDFTVYDLSMRRIYSQKYTGSLEVNTENWLPGIYLYQITGGDARVKAGKIIRE